MDRNPDYFLARIASAEDEIGVQTRHDLVAKMARRGRPWIEQHIKNMLAVLAECPELDRLVRQARVAWQISY